MCVWRLFQRKASHQLNSIARICGVVSFLVWAFACTCLTRFFELSSFGFCVPSGADSKRERQRSSSMVCEKVHSVCDECDMLSMRGQQSIPKEKIEEYKAAFELFDKDGDGHVTVDELREVLGKMGEYPSDEQLRDMICDVDTDNNGTIELPEFIEMMQRYENDPAAMDDDIRLAFRAFDLDGNGQIDRDELKQVLEKLGESLTDEEIAEMIAEADTNGDGVISYEEFRAMMKGP